MIEVERFCLRPGTDPAAFTALDADFQQQVVYRLPGLRRRTTATGDDGSWVVITLWDEHGPQPHDPAHPASATRAACIDTASVERTVYRELPG